MTAETTPVKDEYYQDTRGNPWDYPDETPDYENPVQKLLVDIRRPRRKKVMPVYRGDSRVGVFVYLKPARPVGLILNESLAEKRAVVLGSKEASWHSPLVRQPTRRQFNKMPWAEIFKRNSRHVHGTRLGNSYILPP